MRAVLRVITGQRAGEEVAVETGGVLSVGRSSESDLQLLDLGVSRFHCVVEGVAEGLMVTDLSSSNGTFVNSQRVKRQELAEGDEIAVGAVKLRVVELASPRRSIAGGLFTDRGAADVRIVRSAQPSVTVMLRSEGLAAPAGAAPQSVGRRRARLERDLAALCDIGNQIHSQVSLQRLLPAVVDTVLGVVRAERAFLLLAEEATGEVTPTVVRIAAGSPIDPSLPISRPVVSDSMERGVCILCRDLMAEERYLDGDSLALDHIRSVLCAPLRAGDRVVGALYLDRTADRSPFDEHDLDLLTAISVQAGMALHRAQLIDGLERLFVGAIETLVATVEAKDIYTYGHSARVSKLAWLTASRLGRPAEEQEQIKIAGLLHDIGKIGIPEAILSKPGRLTDDEWAYVRSHPAIGEGIIRQMGSDRLAHVQPMVRHHHERYDGSGYPDGLAGQDIPFGARVLAVADAYDAMTSNRPYRPPFSAEAALAELRRQRGQQFDPDILDAFCAARGDRAAQAEPAPVRREETHSPAQAPGTVPEPEGGQA